ncbi:MAG TPA: hypothetical protein VL490_01175 [Mucilaginibacter sp.]|jgi:hypothetical protein|nr:hypothetical protein [Mucilaginibacter sp.]
MIEITLQINLSPGDINYAEQTIPSLISKHADIKKRLLIVDCCRPQKTKLVDPDKKHPQAVFNERVKRIIQISEAFLKDGLVTDVYYLKPNDPLFEFISKKYLNGLYNCTHGAGGTANMAYWAGIELVQTKYVLHYDGDMLLYQKQGYSWVKNGLAFLSESDDYISAVPRLCPPVADPSFTLPSVHEGRKNTSLENYWYTDFFSTQVFLLDKDKLNRFLPLVRGKLMIELLIRKYGKRAFPLDPEIILFRSMGPRGGKRILLKSKDAWVIHPADKSQLFLDALPQIINKVNKGKYPEAQRGHEDMNLSAWLNFLMTDAG